MEILVTGTAVACLLALLIAALGALGGVAAEALGQTEVRTGAAEQVYEGVVTCSRCGARHSAALGRTAAKCAIMCVHDGAQFALVDGDKIYALTGDLNVLKKVSGERVRVAGLASGNTIQVSSVAAE